MLEDDSLLIHVLGFALVILAASLRCRWCARWNEQRLADALRKLVELVHGSTKRISLVVVPASTEHGVQLSTQATDSGYALVTEALRNAADTGYLIRILVNRKWEKFAGMVLSLSCLMLTLVIANAPWFMPVRL